jgi:hypothetical protein
MFGLLTVGALLVAITGCPPDSGPPSALPGEWAFNFFDLSGTPTFTDPAYIILFEDGTTETNPPDRGLTFTGTATWTRDAGTFSMLHIKGLGNETTYTGTVFAPTYMEGSLHGSAVGPAAGLWTATFVKQTPAP